MKKVFKSLTDYQHARTSSTEMYLGSREQHTQVLPYFDGEKLIMRKFTWVPAVFTAFREPLDNALDEMIAHGNGDTLRVEYDEAKMVFTIEDNGGGLPIHEISTLGPGPAASILLGQARSGSNFEGREYQGGVNGLGAAVTNFTSEWFLLDVWTKGKHFRQLWEEGTYGGKEIHKTKDAVIKPGSKDRSGTRIQFKPSAKVFPDMTLPSDFIRGRLWDIAVANPKLRVFFNGERLILKQNKDPLASTYFRNRSYGLIQIDQEGFNARYYLVPNFADDEVVHSMVNNIPTFDGGPHVNAMRTIFYNMASEIISKQLPPELKKMKIVVKDTDIRDGLLIFNVTRMKDARFDSQPKLRLSTKVTDKIKAGFVESDVKAFLRRNPEWVEMVLERVRRRAHLDDDKNAANKQKKLARSKVAGLTDATGKNRQDCVLFIAEGESAIGGMKNARTPDIHGGYPLRGKIINVSGKSKGKVSQSQVLMEIMAALGLVMNKEPSRGVLRYGAVFIATDEDEDGKNITALILNFFYTFWPTLFQDPKRPFVYKFSTPFIIATKGKERQYTYSHGYEQFQNDLDAGKYDGWKIIRAKGLARLTEIDWKHSLANPVLTPMLDDAKLKETLSMIFDDQRVDDRKEWLGRD